MLIKEAPNRLELMCPAMECNREATEVMVAQEGTDMASVVPDSKEVVMDSVAPDSKEVDQISVVTVAQAPVAADARLVLTAAASAELTLIEITRRNWIASFSTRDLTGTSTSTSTICFQIQPRMKSCPTCTSSMERLVLETTLTAL